MGELTLRRRLKALSGNTIVFKYGGRSLANQQELSRVAEVLVNLVASGSQVVLIHGGGPTISLRLSEANIHHRQVRGLRVTEKRAIPLVRQALEEENERLAPSNR